MASAAASVVSSENITTIPEGGGVSPDEEVELGLSPRLLWIRPLLLEVCVSDKRSGFELERRTFLRHSLWSETTVTTLSLSL